MLFHGRAAYYIQTAVTLATAPIAAAEIAVAGTRSVLAAVRVAAKQIAEEVIGAPIPTKPKFASRSGGEILEGASWDKIPIASKGIGNRFEGVQQASKYLQDMGVSRADRVRILQSFEVDAMRVRTVGQNEFGLRYFSDPNRAGGSYLFETFPASRQSLAIKPEWSSMSGFKQFQIRPGTTILQGPATAQGPYLSGGQTQKFILEWGKDLISP